jgi:hypothetical protein
VLLNTPSHSVDIAGQDCCAQQTGMHMHRMVGSNCLIILSYLNITSDLGTQCLSRQQQADNTLETGNRILTEITVGSSRLQRAPVGPNRLQ